MKTNDYKKEDGIVKSTMKFVANQCIKDDGSIDPQEMMQIFISCVVSHMRLAIYQESHDNFIEQVYEFLKKHKGNFDVE